MKTIENFTKREMRDYVVFVDLNCRITDICRYVFITTKCGNPTINAIQRSVNKILESYGLHKATKEVCEKVYDGIMTIYVQTRFKPNNKIEEAAYNEINSTVEALFKQIAYFGYRPHLDQTFGWHYHWTERFWNTKDKGEMLNLMKQRALQKYNQCLTDKWVRYVDEEYGILTKEDTLDAALCEMRQLVESPETYEGTLEEWLDYKVADNLKFNEEKGFEAWSNWEIKNEAAIKHFGFAA